MIPLSRPFMLAGWLTAFALVAVQLAAADRRPLVQYPNTLSGPTLILSGE